MWQEKIDDRQDCGNGVSDGCDWWWQEESIRGKHSHKGGGVVMMMMVVPVMIIISVVCVWCWSLLVVTAGGERWGGRG